MQDVDSQRTAGRCRAAIAIAFAMASVAASQLAPRQAAAQLAPDRTRGSLTLASALFHNGLAQTDDELSLRLAFDYEHRSGFFAGGSLANVDYAIEAQFTQPRDSQINLYSGYVWRAGDWMANVAISRYLYPDIERNYDYSQLAASFSFRDRYFFTAARISEVLAVYNDAFVYRAGIAMPWRFDLEFEANAGRYRDAGSAGPTYSFWDVGFSRPLGRFTVDLRYHEDTYQQLSLLGNRPNARWVLSVSHAFLPLGRARN